MATAYEHNTKKLFEAILKLNNIEECEHFFNDLCTVKELREMSQRLEVATLLSDGLIYSDIAEKTGASTTTISRVNRSLVYGEGGYKTVIERMKDE
ncbi:MAG: YerC/YecD family TrpR-related protein [Oscillospiraceae bacterium]|nr:YerC/YecD family TrpR-related protein [Ruminococcus sp.]MCD8345196.1 YerC/YecD family TrpR-related protein [Oscillospiraceae bacterium]